MEAILWELRTGAPWRDIPAELCLWKTAYSRFNRWAIKGVWEAYLIACRKHGVTTTEALETLFKGQSPAFVYHDEQISARFGE